jgi:hypothetical protein
MKSIIVLTLASFMMGVAGQINSGIETHKQNAVARSADSTTTTITYVVMAGSIRDSSARYISPPPPI